MLSQPLKPTHSINTNVFKNHFSLSFRYHPFSAVLLPLSGCASKPEVVAAPAAAAPKAVIAIDQTPRGVQIPLPNTVLFQFGKADLNTAAADPYLDKIAMLIKTKSTKPVAIEGHTDNVGSLPSNQQISDARAKVVRDALQARGVPAERLKAEGFAFQRPVVSNSQRRRPCFEPPR